MLDHLGLHAASLRLERAVETVLAQGRVLTPDLGGTASTLELAAAVEAAAVDSATVEQPAAVEAAAGEAVAGAGD